MHQVHGPFGMTLPPFSHASSHPFTARDSASAALARHPARGFTCAALFHLSARQATSPLMEKEALTPRWRDFSKAKLGLGPRAGLPGGPAAAR